MADALVRLKIESQEYDNKIKRAQEGLTRYADECRKAGGTLEYVEKETLEYVKALGNMETVSKTAKGKVAELSNAYTELAVQYKQMTKEEQASPYGQALQGSLEQLKGRITELKGDLGEAGKEIQTSGGFVDSFADALGQLGPVGQMAGKLLKGAFGPVGIAIAAVVGIIKELVDAFKRNEDAMASVQRAAAPFKAIWQQIERVFDRLIPLIADGIEKVSNGIQSMFQKFTGWIGKLADTDLGKKLGLDTVYTQLKKVSAAQDELTTSNQKIADSENELNKLRRQNIVQNANDERTIAKLREEASNKDKVSAADRVKMLREAGDLEEAIMKRNVDERKKELEIIRLKNSLTQSGTQDLEAEAQAEAAVIKAETEFYNKKRMISRQLQAAINEDNRDQAAKVEVPVEPKVDEKTITQQIKEAFEKAKSEYLQGTGSQDMYLDAQMAMNLQSVVDKNGLQGINIPVGVEVTDEEWDTLVAQINEQLEMLGIDPIKIGVEPEGAEAVVATANDTKGAWQAAASAIQAAGSAMGQIDDPAAKIAGTLAQAVASVMLGFAQATASPATGAAGVFGWIAASLSGLATALSVVSTIKSVTKGHADGGLILPNGSAYTGDNIVARLNAGEGILTPRGVSNAEMAMGQLQAAPIRTGGNLSTKIKGGDILIALDNTNRSRGGSRGVYARTR